MPFSVLDDYEVDIDPDIELGDEGGGVTISNPNLSATGGFGIREMRVSDIGAAILVRFYYFVTIENATAEQQILEDGFFVPQMLNGNINVQSHSGFELSDTGSQGSAISFEAFEDTIEAIIGRRGDTLINRTAVRDDVMVFDRNTQDAGIAPVSKIIVPANTTQTYYVAVLTREETDVFTNVNRYRLRFRSVTV